MMKLKEFERFAFTSWSPACSSGLVYLAAITAADEIPASEGTINSPPPLLELFSPDLSSESLDVHPTVAVEVDFKATCLCWAASRTNDELGLLLSGNAVGGLALYDPRVLVDSSGSIAEGHSPSSTCLVRDMDVIERVKCGGRDAVHTGVVRSIDSNRFQTNLFASAADEGEIFIWDIEKMDQPMIPSNKMQPLESITTVAWNPRVQHILATTSAGNCIIWDLRKSEPVVHLTKTMCQFEPHLLAWSPDTATRLCLADPAHPTADIQLWDLRYPKHMLALLGRWPPSPSSELPFASNALGNAGNVNSLAWSPAPQTVRSCPGLTLHDPDLIAVSLTASGALPAVGGGCVSELEPISADFLVVWSVSEALKSVRVEAGSSPAVVNRQPVFIGRLEGGSDADGVGSTNGGVPSTSAVHWLPTWPGLVSVTQSDGWVSIYNLDAGVPGDSTAPTRVLQTRSGNISRSRLASNKVAEAFAEEEVDLRSVGSLEETDLSQATAGIQINDPNQTDLTATGKVGQSVGQLPQPLPRLRLACRWTKRPCGANFGFGGRLASFYSSIDVARRPRSSASLSVTRQTSSGPTDNATISGDTATCIAPQTTENPEISRPVQLTWVDTMDAYPIRGLKSTVQHLTEEKLRGLMENMLHWLDQALTLPREQLITICDNLADLCLPNLVQCNTEWQSPWELLKVQFQPSEDMRMRLSTLLGFDDELVRKEVTSVLDQSPESPTEFQCACQVGSNREVAIENLSALRLALVTGDVDASIRLCMHSTFSALSFPGLSSLGSVALLLSHQYQTPEAYAALQSITMDRLNHIRDLPGIEETWVKSIVALLTGLLKRDWSAVISDWPLEDWPTAVAVLVNHVWVSDVPLFRRLCGMLINRLLDPLSNCSLTPEQQNSAAWACSVIASDLNGLIRSWCRLCDVDASETRGDVLLPLATQLLLLSRAMGCTQTVGRLVQDSTTSVPDALTVTQVLSIVALWLGQIWAGRSDSEVFLGLRLLRFIVDTTTPELNEAAHRLWCSLTDEQRARAPVKFEPPFHCPFLQGPQATIIRCACGAGQQSLAQTAHHTRAGYPHPQFGAHAAQPPAAMTPSPLFVNPPGSQMPTFHSSLGPGYPPSSVPPQTTPLVPPIPTTPLNVPGLSHYSTMTNPPPPSLSNAFQPPVGVNQPWSSMTSGQPIPPTTNAWTPVPSVAPKPPMPSIQAPHPDSRIPSLPKPFVNPGASTSMPNSVQTPPMLPSMPPPPPTVGQSDNLPNPTPAPLPPARPATSRAWNDPPFLAQTYQPPVRPVVSSNQFYDPSQFSASEPPLAPAPPVTSTFSPSTSNIGVNLQTPMGVATQPLAPNQPAPAPGGRLVANVPAPPMPPLPLASFSSTAAPPTNLYAPSAPSSSLHVANSFSLSTPDPLPTNFVQPNVPHLPPTQPVNGFSSDTRVRPLAPPLVSTQRPRPAMDVNQWPAARPLGSPSTAAVTNAEAEPSPASSGLVPSVDGNLEGSHTAQPQLTQGTPVLAEYESVEKTLNNLIHLCRSVGGKPFTNKMDIVDRRLQTLFVALRGGPGAHLMSDQVVSHLRDCVHAAEQADYGAAVNHANLLIQSASGFESIHSFAPGLKILMQSAKQLFPNRVAGAGEPQQPWMMETR